MGKASSEVRTVTATLSRKRTVESDVHSVSNFENYQANRLKLRYKGNDGKKRLAHTLNGSALALPRIMAAIIENGQGETGITLPEELTNYFGTDKILWNER